jgi:hypothetical protein
VNWGKGPSGAASGAGSTANPRPFRLRRASSSDVTGQARRHCFTEGSNCTPVMQEWPSAAALLPRRRL